MKMVVVAGLRWCHVGRTNAVIVVINPLPRKRWKASTSLDSALGKRHTGANSAHKNADKSKWLLQGRCSKGRGRGIDSHMT
ncbi:hypothetical protein BJV78DRAFT_1260854 [Lactifluus subvellereus]|nr:hypothetical protein BJV78DRAFT_1260854 [Lactifluus subvellereus]